MPEHVAASVEAWKNVVAPIVLTIWKEHRAGGRRGPWKWTDAEWASLDAARATAREQIATASTEDRRWLLVAYVDLFAPLGLRDEWLDAILEVPPEHPAWSIPWSFSEGLFDALPQSADPLRFRAYIFAVAAAHDEPHIQAIALYLELEDADRAGDWAHAQTLYARLQAPEFQHGNRAFEASLYYNPERPLRVDRPVPHFCAPAIAGPDEGRDVCLDELFPWREPTLVIGWATWCKPCNEQLPRVIELLRERPLRVIAINYGDEPEHAREHLRTRGVDGWTILHLSHAEMKQRRGQGPLDAYPIPFLALVDSEGMTLAGPPRLDAEALRLTLE